ncbi:SMI1/KNR4 family protein [Kitasatospora sp. NPDC017646]|uniref:SMI1/KNR4 family protein n=1 Tax=Kitasatospora sp. NPDC017646 TaxID=3364024 RepID=UPI0037A07D9C
MEHPDVAALMQVMSAEDGCGEGIDWPTVEAELGLRLPADYKAFMAVYGGGGIDGEAGILLPAAPAEDGLTDPGTIPEETANVRYVWEREGGRAALDVSPLDLLAWGVTSGPDIMCWLTSGSDPDRWPVVVCRRSDPIFQVHLMGMVEFLRRLCLREFETWPLYLSANFFGAPPRYVHWRLEHMRWQAGLDPVTGEPAPGRNSF